MVRAWTVDGLVRAGASESLTAPFATASTTTVNTYGGFVEVIVSGTGNSHASDINDAFYGVPSGIPLSPVFYQLAIGWNGFNFFGCDSAGVHDIKNLISFIAGVGPVTPSATPPYNGVDHTYHFVVSVPANAGQLNFGVSDCAYIDNGGSFHIHVSQLIPRNSPAPALSATATVALAMIVLILGAAGLRRRAAKMHPGV